jgi:quercetin dioxygenase-like cupin family protein
VRACATASAVGAAVLMAIAAVGACHEPQVADVPPLTVAVPPSGAASAPASAAASAPAATSVSAAASASAPALAAASAEPPVKAAFVDLPSKLENGSCTRVVVAVVKGKLTAAKETLAAGDVLVLANAPEMALTGSGLALVARAPITPCVVKVGLATEKTVVRATAARELTWAGGTMHAHLDVAKKVSPEVYLGRLEGTAAVPEHTHPGTWEVLAAVEAAGTFTLAGAPQRLVPRQIVYVPPDTKHAWRPDAGEKLVAIQLYDPPGPEQRFVALDAAAKDAAAKDAGAKK